MKTISLFKPKATETEQHLELKQDLKVRLNLPQDSDAKRQVEMIDLTEADLSVMKSLQPLVKQHIGAIVTQFYKNLEREPSLMQIINTHSSVERLKKTLTRHVIEIFNGRVDRSFFEQRLKIAHIHLQIGLEPKWYMCAFQDLLLTLTKLLDEHIEKKQDFSRAIQAVTKILNFEQQIVLEAYEDENRRRLENEVQKQKKVRDKANQTAEELTSVTQEASAALQELTAQSEEVANFAKNAAATASEMELRSIDGKKQLDQQHSRMDNIQDRTKRIAAEMEQLTDVSKRIQDVVRIVSAIAEQTHLLALNASIEAARAGEHGKGFTVVAGEVRKLAEQTKTSAAEVAELIEQINSQVTSVSESVDHVMDAVVTGTNEMKGINHYFDDIMKTMIDTKEQSGLINDRLKEFLRAISDISEVVEQVASSADHLTGLTVIDSKQV